MKSNLFQKGILLTGAGLLILRTVFPQSAHSISLLIIHLVVIAVVTFILWYVFKPNAK